MSEAHPVPLTAAQRLLAIGLVLGVTLVAFEMTAVITALPTITDRLHGDSLYGAALSAYTLADIVGLVTAGVLADRWGPRLPFLLAVGVFVVGLAVTGTAPSMVVVVLGRTLQGMGTGAYAPISYVLVTRAFPAHRQATMYAVLSAGWVLPSLVAPFFSGLVTQHLGWRWVFLSIIPLALAVGALASRPMRAFGPVPEGEPASPRRILWAIGAAGGVGALVLSLRNPLWWVVVAGSVIGVVVAVPSLRTLLPTGFGRLRPGLPAVLWCRVLATATFIGVDSFVPLAADRIHHVRPLVQGLVIIGASFTWTAGQALVARRPGVAPKRAIALGFGLLAAGVVLVAPVLWHAWPLWATFLSWPVGGLGMGILFNPSTVNAMGYAGPGTEGLVSSQLHLADSLGFSLMGGLGGAVVAVADRTGTDLRAALATLFSGSAVCALAGLAVARRVRPAR